MSKTLLIFCEDSLDGGIEKSSLEVIGLGQELSGQLSLDLKVIVYANIAQEAASYSSGLVYSIEKPEGPASSEVVTATLKIFVKKLTRTRCFLRTRRSDKTSHPDWHIK